MNVSCIKRPKIYNAFRGALNMHLDDSNENLRNMTVLLRSCHCLKTVICNCSSSILKKIPAAFIIDLKTDESLKRSFENKFRR